MKIARSLEIRPNVDPSESVLEVRRNAATRCHEPERNEHGRNQTLGLQAVAAVLFPGSTIVEMSRISLPVETIRIEQ